MADEEKNETGFDSSTDTPIRPAESPLVPPPAGEVLPETGGAREGQLEDQQVDGQPTEEVATDEVSVVEASDDEDQEELSDEEKLMAKLQEAIEVEIEDIGPLYKKLDIRIPRTVIDERMGEQFAELKREAAVPGFRRGRAPLRLVEKRFGHEVGDDTAAQLVSSGYLAATKKLDLKTLGDPLVWAKIPEEVVDESGMSKTVASDKLVTVEKALDHLRIPKEGDFTYSCEVELKPQFELPDLDGIAVTKPAETVTDDDVSEDIRRLLAFRGRYVPVESGPVKADDLVVGNMKVIVDGEAIKSEANAMLAARDQQYQGLDLKGFGEAVVGKSTGDEVQLAITVPDDYDTSELRGKGGTFELAIEDVKRLEIPELTTELLGEIGYDDEADFRATMRSNLEQRLAGRAKEAMRRQVTEHLLGATDFELPEGLSQRQADAIVRRRMVELYQSGMPEAEINKHLDELRVGATEEAASDLKSYFVLDKIADDREIDVSEDEVNGAIASIAAMQGKRFDRMRDELVKNDGMTALYLRLRDAKILDSLLESANVTE